MQKHEFDKITMVLNDGKRRFFLRKFVVDCGLGIVVSIVVQLFRLATGTTFRWEQYFITLGFFLLLYVVMGQILIRKTWKSYEEQYEAEKANFE